MLFFGSLLEQHIKRMPETTEEKIRDNHMFYSDAYSKMEGPKKWMTVEDKNKIHNEIDLRMEELEATGLTREEILFDQQKGIPLSNDPFFQFVKNVRTAREMLIKPGEEFSVERVIEKALRQDIGPDPSKAALNHNFRYNNPEDNLFSIFEYKKKYRIKDPVLDAHDNFYKSDFLAKRLKEQEFMSK